MKINPYIARRLAPISKDIVFGYKSQSMRKGTNWISSFTYIYTTPSIASLVKIHQIIQFRIKNIVWYNVNQTKIRRFPYRSPLLEILNIFKGGMGTLSKIRFGARQFDKFGVLNKYSPAIKTNFQLLGNSFDIEEW